MDALNSRDDYRDALIALLPSGRVWPKDPASLQFRLAAGLGISLERFDLRAQQLLVEAFPATAAELLPEWETSLGLPDPCAGQSPTIAQRQGQVVARLTDSGGQSAQRFVDFAAALGYTVTITNFARFRAGRSRVGQAACGAGWIHTWRVNSQTQVVTRFRAGSSRAGEALGTWGNAVLECELEARQPAHTILQFAYLIPGELDFSDPDQSGLLGGL